jgi:hypothetical protein
LSADSRHAGGCLCGAIRYRAAKPPVMVTHCHCASCRRAAGSAFVTWATFRAGDFAFIAGEPARFRSSPKVERTFCPSCGTSLTYRHDDHADEVDVTVGSLDEPAAVAPLDHVWTQAKLPWLKVDDGLPQLERDHWYHGYPKRT